MSPNPWMSTHLRSPLQVETDTHAGGVVFADMWVENLLLQPDGTVRYWSESIMRSLNQQPEFDCAGRWEQKGPHLVIHCTLWPDKEVQMKCYCRWDEEAGLLIGDMYWSNDTSQQQMGRVFAPVAA